MAATAKKTPKLSTFSLTPILVAGIYVAGYTSGRFAFELMRSDYANLILGLRVNTWVAALIFLAGAAGFVVLFRCERSVAISAATATRHTPAPDPRVPATGQNTPKDGAGAR